MNLQYDGCPLPKPGPITRLANKLVLMDTRIRLILEFFFRLASNVVEDIESSKNGFDVLWKLIFVLLPVGVALLIYGALFVVYILASRVILAPAALYSLSKKAWAATLEEHNNG